MNGKTVYYSIEDMANAVVEYFNAPKKWFATSDTHFGVEKTLKTSCRPFRNVYEMNYAMISNWNKKIRSKDGIIHLGDFGEHGILSCLNFGEMKFVLGNHEIDENTTEFNDKRVSVIPSGSIATYRGKKYCLTHKPIQSGLDFNYFYLYGHIHRAQIAKRNGINVGILKIG